MAAVFISDPVNVDLYVYLLWLRGQSIFQIVKYQLSCLTGNHPNPKSKSTESKLVELLARDVSDKCQVLEFLEPYLQQPDMLIKQMNFQIEPEVQRYMVSKYYEFDDTVIRELLGRKLTTRARKDLDEIVETTGIPLRSCRRQFDNLRAIFNALDDRNFEGNLVFTIETLFLLSTELARRYACLMFLLVNKFTVRTHDNKSVKRTAIFSCRDLEYFASLILAFWIQVDEFMDHATSFVASEDEVMNRNDSSKHTKVHNSTLPGDHNDAKAQTVVPSNEKGQEDTSVGRATTEDSGQHSTETALAKAANPTSPASEPKGSDKERPLLATDETTSSPAGASVGNYLLSSPVAWSSSLRAASKPALDAAHFQQLYEQTLVLPSSADASIGGNATLVHQIPAMRTLTSKGNSVDLGAVFTSRLRDVRTLLFNDRTLFDNLQRNVMKMISQSTVHNSEKNPFRKIQPHFRQFLKALLNIGGGLAQAKEFRDIFEDILVFLSDSLVEMKLSHAQASLLFDTIKNEINHMFPKYRNECTAYIYVASRIALVGLYRIAGE